jgi:hypothetical protein
VILRKAGNKEARNSDTLTSSDGMLSHGLPKKGGPVARDFWKSSFVANAQAWQQDTLSVG